MNPMKEKSLYEQHKNRILEQSDAFIALLTKRGMLGDRQIEDEKKRGVLQEKNRTRYHNTLMLLQHYRTIVWVMESFPDTIAEELEKPFEQLDTLLEHVDSEVARGNKKLENRIAGAKKTRLLIERVNEALTVLRNKPENGEKLYQLIYLTYIAPEKMNVPELLYRLNLSSRHYYRLRQQAITVLSIRLWSAPTAEIELWVEMLELLEKDDMGK